MTSPFWGGPLLGLIVLTLLVALPIKVGAHLVKAEHRGLIRCGFTAFVAALVALMHLGWLLASPPPAGSVSI